MTLLETLKKQIGQFVSTDGSTSEQPFNAQEAILAKLVPAQQTQESPFKSFEEVYKTSYSHGLESIYALENVDIKSVRRIGESKPHEPEVQAPPPPRRTQAVHFSDQLEFDFGLGYRSWIASFVLTEPIQVLQLSPQAERILLGHGKKQIQSLLNMESLDYLALKRMGQGHIDETQQKLKTYIQDEFLEKSSDIHFAAFLRSLLGGLDRKKLSVALGAFQLSDLFPLTAAEAVETKHLSAEKREEWMNHMRAEFLSTSRVEFLESKIHEILTVFVKPWIRDRKGIATGEEIEERIIRVSRDPVAAQKIIGLLCSVYGNGENVIRKYLLQADAGVYCADMSTVQNYRLIIQKAYSYFYHPDLTYVFSQLISLMEREFGLEWISFPPGFIEKVLRSCPAFRVRKGERNLLHIRLS